jgi:hypothetical protein
MPSRASIVVMGALSLACAGTAFWILMAPDEEFSSRHGVGFIFGLTLAMEIMFQVATQARRRMLATEAERREQHSTEQDERWRTDTAARWFYPGTDRMVLEVVQDQGVWLARGPFLLDYDGPRPVDAWVTLPSEAYAKVLVVDVESDGHRPCDCPVTAQMRARFGMRWAEPDDAVDSDV